VDDNQGARQVKEHLDRARHQLDLTMAGIWGAVRGTAPADRWDGSRASLEAATEQIAGALAVLASMDKLEPYCTVCGQPILSLMAGWSHFTAAGDAVLADRAGHEPELDWRPSREGSTDD
jgi:hypothetical protein